MCVNGAKRIQTKCARCVNAGTPGMAGLGTQHIVNSDVRRRDASREKNADSSLSRSRHENAVITCGTETASGLGKDGDGPQTCSFSGFGTESGTEGAVLSASFRKETYKRDGAELLGR